MSSETEGWQSLVYCPEGINNGLASPFGKNRCAARPKETFNAWKMYFTYILRSAKTGRFYYGATSNLEERLKYHNRGAVRSTKSARPWVLHYMEEFSSSHEAFEREKFFKTIEGYLYLKENRII